MQYVMSRSGRQHEELDSSNRAHVAQLRRLVLLLLVWSFFMTLGVAVSISLQFVLPRPPNKEVTVQGKSNHPEIMMYDFSESTRPSDDGSFELKWKNVTGNVKVEVQEDGNYFLYLQVVLQDPSPNMSSSHLPTLLSVLWPSLSCFPPHRVRKTSESEREAFPRSISAQSKTSQKYVTERDSEGKNADTEAEIAHSFVDQKHFFRQ
ncbi:hypothetical protein SRHO_G00013770 [Serrasalmus rhombeus]